MPVYVFIFIALIVFVLFGVFNVLNAVFVESVLNNRDKELLIQAEQHKTKLFMRDMADLFAEGPLIPSIPFTSILTFTNLKTVPKRQTST